MTDKEQRDRPAGRRFSRRLVLLLSGLILAVIAAGAGVHLERASRFEPELLRPPACALFLDRHGQALRFVPDERGERHLWAPLEAVPEQVRLAFVAAEDERFFLHHGVDPLAVLRACKDNLASGRIVSGASTITQQLCRLAYPRGRSLHQKLVEALRAVRVEARLSKAEILSLYLNRVPLGNNLVGLAAGARVYFDKDLSDLTAAEAAVLAALPKSPGRLNPYGPDRDRLLERQRWVLGRMAGLGFLSGKEAGLALAEEIRFEPKSFPMEASHAVDLLLAQSEEAGLSGPVRTTIDLTLQRRVEQVLAAHRTRLAYRGASQAAAVVLENKTGRILALAGSLEYGPRDEGFVNGAAALRSPGSTLKPFLYALALDMGHSAAEVIEDVPRRFRTPGGEYIPANFDRRAYGPVSMREALGNSLNLSAIQMLNRIGYEPLYELLKRLDLINHPQRGPDHYGLGLVVGNPEVSLIQLAAAYACLANQGLYQKPALLLDGPDRPASRVFSAEAAYIISHILSDPSARSLAFGGSLAMNRPYRLALKTGTSTRYRDCWTVGYTPDYTVAVWAGNFDGRPTWFLSGASASAPILAEIMDLLCRLADPPPFVAPPGLTRLAVCSISGLRPGPACPHVKEEFFIKGTEPGRECTFHQTATDWHHLPTRFAGWLYERHLKGSEGRYRLAGFDPDLNSAFRSAAKPAPKAPAGTQGPVSLGEDLRSLALSGPPPDGGGGLKIVSPLDGERRLAGLGPEEGRIVFQAVCDQPIAELAWFVDGVEEVRTGPPFQTALALPQGRHKVTALTPQGLADSVVVFIE